MWPLLFLIQLLLCQPMSFSFSPTCPSEEVSDRVIWWAPGSLPTGCSSPRSAPTWVLSMGCSPSGTDCSRMGHLQGRTSCQKTCSSVGSSPWVHRSTSPARSLLQYGVSTGCSFLQGTSTSCDVGSYTSFRVDVCSTMDLHGLQGDNMLIHGLHHRLQGNFCSFLTFLSQLLLCSSFCPFINILSQRFYQRC